MAAPAIPVLTKEPGRRDPGRGLRITLRHAVSLCVVVSAAALAALLNHPARALAREPPGRDPFEVATTAVLSDRSEKVRVQAALVLGRAGDARAAPYLTRALADRSPLVRAMAAKSLGYVGDWQARPSLEVAARDPHPMVRRQATAALEALSERQTLSPIAVQPMGDRTHRASGELRQRMRGLVSTELRGLGKKGAGGYTVDGAIKTLSLSDHANLVEVKCGVELVLSTGGKAIVMMSSGEAIVQRPRRQFRAPMKSSMEIEALEHAVRGASDELRQHLASNVP